MSSVEINRAQYSGYTITCDRPPLSAAFPALLYAALPALFFWLIGWTVHWVYRGFRPAKET